MSHENNISMTNFVSYFNERHFVEELWFIDLGASLHISSQKERFSSYQKVEGGKVLLGNNSYHHIVGRGAVSLL